MLNILWPIMVIISIIYAILNGRILEINTVIFDSTKQAVELVIYMFGTITLWSGIMKIASKTHIIKILKQILKPVLNKLFADIKTDENTYNDITMNIIANILGLGNAATPLGIKAMESMQKNNPEKDKITNSMGLFIVLNTASIQIIPTTVISIRHSLGSINPTEIIVPVWIATTCAAFCAIVSAKILMKRL